MQRVELTLIVVAAVIAVVIGGCGGGSVSSATGEISVTVVFPEQSQPAGPAPQELPRATNSVRIQVVAPAGSTGPVVPDLVIRRDSNNVQVGGTVKGVPPGDYMVQALAYESFDGNGPVIAWAMASVEVIAGQTCKVHLVTDALVVVVEVLPPTLNLIVRELAPLAATCYDADGNVVLANVEWASTNATFASVSSAGVVEALAEGTCTVTATEPESGCEGSCEVVVFR